MPQRFKLQNPHPWLPILLVFGSVLFALVQFSDRGFDVVSFWFLVPLVVVAFFLFRSRNNYIELAEGHLTWVQGGHTLRKIAVSEIGRVTRNGKFVNIFLPGESQRRRLPFFRRTSPSGWVSIPAEDAEGLFSSVEHSLNIHGDRDAAKGTSDDRLQASPTIELVPAPRWRRLLAMALDAFVLVSILTTVALALTIDLDEGEESNASDWYALVIAAAWVVYIWLANVIGISLGKMQFGLRLVRAGSNESPGLVSGTLRTLVALSGFGICLVLMFITPVPVFYVGAAVLLIESAWSFVDPQRRALHDFAAGTRVVQAVERLASDEVEAESAVVC